MARPDRRGLLTAAAIVIAALSARSMPAQQTTPPPGKSSAAPKAQPDDRPAGNAGNGKLIFVRYGCYECHNYAANGGAAGARLAPRPIPFSEFTRYVRKPTGEMPPYTAKVVTDQEIADIYAFLLTIPDPPPPAGAAKSGRGGRPPRQRIR